jgi:hypothetical protein
MMAGGLMFNGRRMYLSSNKLTMKPHGFMEYRMEYSIRGQEDKEFKVTLLEVMEAIKKVMVAKEMMEECAPKLSEFTDNDNIAETKDELPDALSAEFFTDMEKHAQKVLKDGGNFCLGTKSGASVSNCMTINWKPQCGAFDADKATIRVIRYKDDAVIILSSSDEAGEVQEKSYRLVKKDWIEHKQEMNGLLSLVAARSSQDPVAVQQLVDMINKTFDFVSNNAFRQ